MLFSKAFMAKIHTNRRQTCRSNVEILERFFMEYDLPVSHSQKERESLRHLVQRWRREAEYLTRQPRIINDDLVTRIDEHEYTGGPPKYDENE